MGYTKAQIVDETFQQELQKRGFSWTQDDEGYYIVHVTSGTIQVNLENAHRDYLCGNDLAMVHRFIESIAEHVGYETPSWSEAQKMLVFAISTLDSKQLEQMIHIPINDDIGKFYIMTLPNSGKKVLLNASHSDSWQVTKDEVIEVAENNMAAMVRQCEITIDIIKEMKLGTVDCPDPALKASIPFACGFQEWVTPKLGWPILFMMPVQDFLFLVPESNIELIPHLGSAVLNEFNNSPYTISPHVYKLDEEGVQEIGSFQERDDN